jgi:hypothetical protein
MNEMEDRLRAAYRGATQLIQPGNIRTLGEQSAAISWPANPAAPRSRRWVTAFAAAAAVAVIAAGAAAVGPHLLAGHRHGHRTTSSSTTAQHGQGQHGRAAKHSGQPLPPSHIAARFVVALSASDSATIAVHSATNGRVIAVTRPLADGQTVGAMATSNGVTYVVAAWQSGVCGTLFYYFTLNSSGHPSKLVPFTLARADEQISSIALSADGKSLAYWGQQCGSFHNSPPADLGLVNLTTSQTKLWSLPGQEDIGPLYLNSDGSLLSYSVSLTKLFPAAVYLLHTSSPAGRAVIRSKLLVKATQFGSLDDVGSAALTPDGSTVYFTTYATGADFDNVWQLRSYAIATGQLQSIGSYTGVPGWLVASPPVTQALVTTQPKPGHPDWDILKLNLADGPFRVLTGDGWQPGSNEYYW